MTQHALSPNNRQHWTVEAVSPLGLWLEAQVRRLRDWHISRRDHRANRRLIRNLDRSVLRDLGLSRADVGRLEDPPLPFSHGSDGYEAMIPADMDLRSTMDELLKRMSAAKRNG